MKEKIFNILNQTSYYLRFITVLGVVVFISFLFPNHTNFKYDYQIGRTWLYDDLIAPMDFPILKPENKYSQEQNTIASKEPIVFSYKGVGIDHLKNGIYSAIELHMDNNVSLGSGTLTLIDVILRESYKQPVIQNEELRIHNGDRYRLVKNSKTSILDKREVQTTKSIAEAILNKISIGSINDTEGLINEISIILPSNYEFNQKLYDQFTAEAKSKIPSTLGLLKKGEVIVNSGEIISEKAYMKLASYEKALGENSKTKDKYYVFGGYFLLTFLLMLALVMYILKYFPEVFNTYKSLLFILIWTVIYSYLVYVIENKTTLNTYMIPFAIAPIIIKNFFNERLALFVHIVVVLIASFLSRLGYEFTFLQIMVGIITILYVSETRDFTKFYKAIIIIFLSYGLGFFGLSLINEGGLATIPWQMYIWFFINALLVMLAYPFIPLLEKLFGFVSSLTLVELADLNRPLLKDLLTKTPGTFQHSLQVGNLSEAMADKIGANSLLVKVGALYHDIGKIQNPEFFIENQKGESPHNDISYFESAKKIIGHIIHGKKIALKAKLPKIIVDFIMTHHGTTRVEYFYRKQMQEFPDREFDETLFMYPGPKPTSKEQTILMIADSTEAASKSLKSPTGQDIDKLVDSIIEGKMKANQFDESALSFEELGIITNVLKSMLRSINHVRIEYPEEVKKKEIIDK